ncbi:AAA family ATPase [Glaciecola sp.]|jgi:DNA polymerase-3 subunit delta'|uniref:AAA family ATPase n=1 Tax=Glaciecola sp. MF2-115 TaxID=3384827 RepID=UPI0039890A5E
MYPWLQSAFETLLKRYQDDKLHHGLLFMGPVDLGKTNLCQELAKALLCKTVTNSQIKTNVDASVNVGVDGNIGLFGDDHQPNEISYSNNIDLNACGTCKSCLLIDAGSHPDLHIITTEKSQIGVDAIRQAISKVSQTAQLSGNKVVIIPQIESMSESASNALLKTLEEPTSNTYLLMTTNELQRLLPTILSRCEKITVPTPTYEQSCQWLSAFDIQLPTKEALIAHGSSPVTFKRELEDPDSLGFDDFKATKEGIVNGSDSANRAAQKWQSDATKVAKWLAQHWLEKYKSTESEVAYENYQACILAAKRMHHPGLNKSLIIAPLFAQLRAVSSNQFSSKI